MIRDGWIPVYNNYQYKAAKKSHLIMTLTGVLTPVVVLTIYAEVRNIHNYLFFVTLIICIIMFQVMIFVISWWNNLKLLRITPVGIEYKKEGGTEGIIPWGNLIKIVETKIIPDIGTPIYYFVYYKDKAKKKKDTLGAFNEECLYHIRKYLKERSDIKIPIESSG